MSEKNEHFPTAPQAGLLLVALFLAEVLVGATLRDANGVLGLDIWSLEALAVVLANGLVLSVVLHHKGLSHRGLIHPSSTSPGATFALLWLPILAVTPLTVFSSIALNTWLERLLPVSAWEQAAFEHMADGGIAAVLSACVLAPVVEELLFRGVVLRSFLHQYPRGAAIAGSALLFGFAHMNIYQFVGATGFGLLSGWLYDRTRSLLPCITLHMAHNTFVTLLARWAQDLPDADADLPAVAWAGALGLGLLGAATLRWLLVRPVRTGPASAP